jgi:peptidoglycan/xylan/chitin deacetylase (PgdA/CDA1 family)
MSTVRPGFRASRLGSFALAGTAHPGAGWAGSPALDTPTAAIGRSRPLVLMYHGVGERPAAADPYNLFVPAGRLAGHLTSLLWRGWRPLRLAEYLAGAAGARRFLVTFDDGYRSVHDDALPLLAELGVPATVFVCAGLLGGTSTWMPEMPDEPLVTAEHVQALHAGGFDIGLHGLDHTLLPRLSAEQLHRQTWGAADRLAQVTGEWPRAFAYPGGVHDAAARSAVSAAGMRAAFATHSDVGPLGLSRVDVNSTDTRLTFRVKTARGYRPLRRAAGTLPGLRPALHALLGNAKRLN